MNTYVIRVHVIFCLSPSLASSAFIHAIFGISTENHFERKQFHEVEITKMKQSKKKKNKKGVDNI